MHNTEFQGIMHSSSVRFLARIALIAALLWPPFTLSDDDGKPAATTDPATDALLKEKARLEAELGIEKAENEIFKARIGEFSATDLPKGDIGIDGLTAEPLIIGVRAASKVAADIADEVNSAISEANSPGVAVVALFSASDLQSLAEYQAFRGQVRLVKQRAGEAIAQRPAVPDKFDECPGDEPQFKSTIAPASLLLLSTAISLTGLFKVDRTLKGSSVTVDDFSLAALTSKFLLAKQLKVVYPPAFYPMVASDKPDSILEDLTTLRDQLREEIEITKSHQARVNEAANGTICPEKWKPIKDNVDAYLAAVTRVENLLDTVRDGLTEQKDQNGLTRLVGYQRAQALATALGENPFILQLKAIGVGGTTQTTKNVLYSSLKFSGGAVISYMLTDKDGIVVRAGTVSAYGGSMTAKELAGRAKGTVASCKDDKSHKKRTGASVDCPAPTESQGVNANPAPAASLGGPGT